jgi:hypothetical protein
LEPTSYQSIIKSPHHRGTKIGQQEQELVFFTVSVSAAQDGRQIVYRSGSKSGSNFRRISQDWTGYISVSFS